MAEANEQISNKSTVHDHEEPPDQGHSMELTLEDALLAGPDLTPVLHSDGPLHASIQSSYKDNPFFKLILDDPTANQLFQVGGSLIWMTNMKGDTVFCILKGDHEGRSIHKIVLDQAHMVIRHFRYQQMSEYAR